MALTILERRLNVKDYTLLVRDFRDEHKSPVFAEMRVFDGTGAELPDLHCAIYASERVETIKELRFEIGLRLKAKNRKGAS
jgi:hypothetical protein